MDFEKRKPKDPEPTATIMPFGKHKGSSIAELPSSYLDWLMGQDWFVEQKRNFVLVEVILKELETRKRSGYEPPLEEEEKA